MGGGKVAWLTARMADGVSVASAWPLAANFLVPPHSPAPLPPAPARRPLRGSFRANPFDFRLHEIPANNNLCAPAHPLPMLMW